MYSYYGELCTKMYESDKSLAHEKEIAFYYSFVRDKAMRVLEPMCGNGRFLIPFMQKGVAIEGFDLSEEMLKVCQEKGKRLNLQPKVFQARIEEYKSDELYDLIMIPIGSFSLLPDQLVGRSLDNLKGLLKRDGKLLLTIVTKSDDIEEYSEWKETNRKDFIAETIVEYRKASYDKETSILHIELKYEALQERQIIKTELMDFPIRLYRQEEFIHILCENGFHNIQVHKVDIGNGSSVVYECSK